MEGLMERLMEGLMERTDGGTDGETDGGTDGETDKNTDMGNYYFFLMKSKRKTKAVPLICLSVFLSHFFTTTSNINYSVIVLSYNTF